MAKIFKNEAELKKFLEYKCKAAIADAERKVYNAIEKCLVQYYEQFTPEEYIRTKKLYHALVKVRSKDGFATEIYFDENMMDYQTGLIKIQSTPTTGRMGYATWGADEVLDTAMNGSHGGYTEGVAIWEKSHSILGDINKLLVQTLKEQGLTVVRK